jgi:NADPH:quinone reductase-like Zn-dependent oxidoreductase
MTRAITYTSAGDPADVLEATEIPDPPSPGPGQIQIEVRAFPVHPGDLLGVRFGPRIPGQRTVAGLEAFGVVVAAGPGVDTPTVGTRVTVFPNPESWAQRINVAAELAVPVPASTSDEVAAQLVCNPLTALLLYRVAQQHFSVGFDGVIVNNAANSAVGRLFTTVAGRHHVPTISVVRSTARAHEPPGSEVLTALLARPSAAPVQIARRQRRSCRGCPPARNAPHCLWSRSGHGQDRGNLSVGPRR